MRTPLRRLAVMVDEPHEGSFHWVLIEATGGYIEAWIQVSESEKMYETYHEAMTAGLLVLQAQIEDLDLGSREAARSIEACSVRVSVQRWVAESWAPRRSSARPA